MDKQMDMGNTLGLTVTTIVDNSKMVRKAVKVFGRKTDLGNQMNSMVHIMTI